MNSVTCEPIQVLPDLRARNYSSDLGRFISEDPIGYISGEKNLWRYSANNPVLLVDPLGYFCVDNLLSRARQNFKLTVASTSFVSDSAAFASIFDSIMDQGLTGAGKPLSKIFRQITAVGEAGKFSALRRIAPNIGKQIAKTIGKGIGVGFGAELAFLGGIVTGSLYEALIYEIIWGKGCKEDEKCQ
ncbi:MAG: RHS repeat-associated core domain-containing protein [Bdellovibrionota bacterium]|nr:RHS repeat-associated core domain-containing protein [Bdellovibrionota bacterium]